MAVAAWLLLFLAIGWCAVTLWRARDGWIRVVAAAILLLSLRQFTTAAGLDRLWPIPEDWTFLVRTVGALIVLFVVTRSASERTRFEDALRTSEHKLRLIADNATEAILAYDMDRRLSYVNPSIEKLTGYTIAEMHKQHFINWIHPDDEARMMQKWEQLFAGIGFCDVEYRMVSKTGELKWISASWGPLLDEDGIQVGVQGRERDITERSRAEEELKRANEQLSLLLNSLPAAIYTSRIDGDFDATYVSNSVEALTGYPAEQFTGGKGFWADRIHPEDFPRLPAAIDRIFKTGVHEWEYRWRVADGRYRWFTESVCLVRRADGVPSHIAGVWQDVTLRKQAEESLRASEERFRQMADAIEQTFWISDPGMPSILYVSPAYAKIWGRSCESLLRDPGSFLESVHPEDRERVREFLAAQQKDIAEQVYRIVRPDGECRWIHDRAYPIPNAAGDVYRVVGIADDITRQRRLEEQLRQSQKMEAIGRLAGGAAHDFNNLLTIVSCYAHLLSDEMDPEGPLPSYAEEILKAADRATQLTQQLLTFSRRQIVQPKVIDLNEVVAGMDGMLRRLIGEDIELATVLTPHLGMVRADPNQCEQVILNLALNARDAMANGGRLTIETAGLDLDASNAGDCPSLPLGRYVVLRVRDTGCGMDPETHAHLFEPFFTTKPAGRGTGLGLSTVYGIIKQNGGDIVVTSTPNEGTSFTICLPRLEGNADPLASRELRESQGRRGSETILITEDEQGVRSVLRNILSQSGYSILEAGDAREALALLEHHEGPIHLLLTDVVMPQMGGRELAGRAARVRTGIRILFMSGYTDDAVLHKDVLDAGVAFIQKPFAPEILARKVREVLDAPPAGGTA
jgi:PAS domain S-box-containing protein